MSSDNAHVESRDAIIVMFAPDLYPIAAIKSAAYRFANRASVEINPTSQGIECRLNPLKAIGGVDGAALKDDFLIEVLDHDLRLSIASETEAVRNLILSVAFSKTGLQG